MKTVNDLMIWLNNQFGLNLPTTASFLRWPMLQKLWELPLLSGFPVGKLPWKVQVKGDWELIRGLKPASEITIEVKSREQFLAEQGRVHQYGKIDPQTGKPDHI